MSAAVAFRKTCYSATGKEILRDLDLEIETGETLALVGRSGSGKTTALKLVNGLLFPSRGEVLVNGRPTHAWDPVELRRGIGYVIQEAGLFPHFTVAQNVALGPRLAGWEPLKIEARVREMLELVSLAPAEYSHRYPRELSGGQRQRVGVARALAANPMLLLFDEPFGALDPITRADLQQEFLHLKKALGKTAILVTHDLREALLLGDRVGLLREGRLEVLGTPQEFRHARGEEVELFLRSL
jgi:osmoprotectant transport system ATP-binding protein